MVFRKFFENHSKPYIKLVLFQIFMILPLGVLYILANIIFQRGVKNTSNSDFNCTESWNHTNVTADILYFDVFKLVDWYFNPVLWVGICCLLQALSHMFERKYTKKLLGISQFKS